MKNVGIIGTGIAGLHLALRLQQEGIRTTLYAERTPDDMRAGRLPNSVARFHHTIERERLLGVNHWDTTDYAMRCAHLYIKGDPPLTFRGHIDRPASFLDFRIYLPRLVEDYVDRGGDLRVGRLDATDVLRLAGVHDLVVVAAGHRGLTGLFPRDAARSPYDQPQRTLCAGIFSGLAPLEPVGLGFNISPGVGEVFHAPYVSFDGPTCSLLFEGIPGGPFDALTARRYEDDPAGFDALVLDLLEEHAPQAFAAVDRRSFGLSRPLDLLQGAITPTVRRAWTTMPDGSCVMAVGDAWVAHDPIIGQGANTASASAWELAEGILAADTFDEDFCRSAEERMWGYAQYPTEWGHAFLQPPPEHIIGLLVQAAGNQRLADAFVHGFEDPAYMWTGIRTPEAAAGFAAAAA